MKNQKRVHPHELLELLDLEERIMLAGELGLAPPVNLIDSSFRDNISKFSATTLLTTIVQLRRPFIQMLHEVYQFMEGKEASGRATTRAVILPGARGELRLPFDPVLKNVVATTLNSWVTSASIDSLEKRVRELTAFVGQQMDDIHGSWIRSESDVSHALRYDPILQTVAHNFDIWRQVYHPEDLQRVEEFFTDLEQVVSTLRTVLRVSDENDWIPISTVKTVFRQLEDARDTVQYKLRDIEASQPRRHDRWGPDKEIDEHEWGKMLEKARIVKEEIFAACAFQTSATAIYDFLNLELWRERWRIYELWIFTHLLQLFENLGFKIDISARVCDGVWSLKFTRDTRPVALLYGANANLEAYYQLYAKGKDKGDMPDIAFRKKGGEFLVILDPKHGKSYDRVALADLAKRYARAFSANLTVIHNFYPMTYTYEVVSEHPRCLIISNVAPNTEEVARLDHEIIAIVPESWLPEGDSIVILIDVSSSTQPFHKRMTEAIERVLSNSPRRVLPGSIIILYSDRLVKEISLSDLRNTNEVLTSVSGGGTDLASGLETAVKKLESMRAPRFLLCFTDGQDSFDTVAMSERIRSAGLQLRVYEAVDSDKKTPLQELAHISGGSYERI